MWLKNRKRSCLHQKKVQLFILATNLASKIRHKMASNWMRRFHPKPWASNFWKKGTWRRTSTSSTWPTRPLLPSSIQVRTSKSYTTPSNASSTASTRRPKIYLISRKHWCKAKATGALATQSAASRPTWPWHPCSRRTTCKISKLPPTFTSGA